MDLGLEERPEDDGLAVDDANELLGVTGVEHVGAVGPDAVAGVRPGPLGEHWPAVDARRAVAALLRRGDADLPFQLDLVRDLKRMAADLKMEAAGRLVHARDQTAVDRIKRVDLDVRV